MVLELTGPVVSSIFYFYPYLGRWSYLTNIFQVGWNHQLEKHLPFHFILGSFYVHVTFIFRLSGTCRWIFISFFCEHRRYFFSDIPGAMPVAWMHVIYGCHRSQYIYFCQSVCLAFSNDVWGGCTRKFSLNSQELLLSLLQPPMSKISQLGQLGVFL